MEFGVITLPNRKRKGLYLERHGLVMVLAYFRSNEDAELFEKCLLWVEQQFAKSQCAKKRNT